MVAAVKRTGHLTLKEWAKKARLPNPADIADLLTQSNEIMDDMAKLDIGRKKPRKRPNYMRLRLERLVGKRKAKLVLRALLKPTAAMVDAGWDTEEGAKAVWIAMAKAALE